MAKVALTFDIDWATDATIKYTLQMLEKHQAKATFFCTHATSVFDAIDTRKYELALHPNFNPALEGSGQSYKDIFDSLHKLYPQAKGFRSHSLTESSHILQYARQVGLLWDSNLLLPVPTKPFWHPLGLLRIPFSWEDDVHFYFNRLFRFDAAVLKNEKITIFNFHPVHIFLNTDTQETYQKAKPWYKDDEKLITCRNTTTAGACDYLSDLLNEPNNAYYTLSEIYNQQMSAEGSDETKSYY